MKKKGIIAAALTLIMSFGLCTVCFAATGVSANEQKILDAIKTVEVAEGKKIDLPEKYLLQAEQFLASNDLTDEAVKACLAKVDEAKKVVVDIAQANGGDVTPASLKAYVTTNADAAKKLTDAVNAVGDAVGVKLEVKIDGNGASYAYSDVTGDKVPVSGSVIKNTGYGMGATATVAVLGVAALCGCVLVASKKELFAK